MARKRSDRTEGVAVSAEIDANPSDKTTSGEAGRTVLLNLPFSFMDEGSSEASEIDILRILSRKKWFIAAVSIAAAVLAGVYAYTRTPIYRSVAVIEIAGRSDPSNRIGDALVLLSARTREFETERYMLRTRALAGRLVERAKLAQSPDFRPAGDGPAARIAGAVESWASWDKSSGFDQPATASHDAVREALINKVLRRISVVPEEGTRLIQLSMEASDPKLASDTLAKYIEIYKEQRLNKKRTATSRASALLKEEIERVGDRLAKSLSSVVEFANRNGLVSLGEDANYATLVYNKAAEELAESKRIRVQVEALLNGGTPLIPTGLPVQIKPPEVTALRERLSTLEDRYDKLRQVHAEKSPRLAMVRRQIAFLRRKIADMERTAAASALSRLKKDEIRRKEALDEAKKEAMNVNALGVEYAVLRKDVETNEHLYRLLLKKAKEVDLRAQIINSGVNVVDPPSMPETPVSSRKGFIIALGTLLGLGCGVLGAALLDRMDDTVRLSEDVEKRLGLPRLGVIPDSRTTGGENVRNVTGSPELLVHEEPASPLSEAVRSVKTSIFLSTPGNPVESIVVVSSTPGEGKTFMATCIGIAVSAGPANVIIIDCDMRKPRLAKVFGQSGLGSGLSTVLTRDDVPIESVIRKSPVNRLHFIPSGPLPPNPAALLESDRMRRVTDRLKEMYDFVVFDCPPVLGFSDAQTLAAFADGIVLVAREGYVPVEMLREASTRLSLTDCRLLGVVLNMVDMRRYASLAYGHYDYYARERTVAGRTAHVTKGPGSWIKRAWKSTRLGRPARSDNRNRDFILRP